MISYSNMYTYINSAWGMFQILKSVYVFCSQSELYTIDTQSVLSFLVSHVHSEGHRQKRHNREGQWLRQTQKGERLGFVAMAMTYCQTAQLLVVAGSGFKRKGGRGASVKRRANELSLFIPNSALLINRPRSRASLVSPFATWALDFSASSRVEPTGAQQPNSARLTHLWAACSQPVFTSSHVRVAPCFSYLKWFFPFNISTYGWV